MGRDYPPLFLLATVLIAILSITNPAFGRTTKFEKSDGSTTVGSEKPANLLHGHLGFPFSFPFPFPYPFPYPFPGGVLGFPGGLWGFPLGWLGGFGGFPGPFLGGRGGFPGGRGGFPGGRGGFPGGYFGGHGGFPGGPGGSLGVAQSYAGIPSVQGKKESKSP